MPAKPSPSADFANPSIFASPLPRQAMRAWLYALTYAHQKGRRARARFRLPRTFTTYRTCSTLSTICNGLLTSIDSPLIVPSFNFWGYVLPRGLGARLGQQMLFDFNVRTSASVRGVMTSRMSSSQGRGHDQLSMPKSATSFLSQAASDRLRPRDRLCADHRAKNRNPLLFVQHCLSSIHRI